MPLCPPSHLTKSAPTTSSGTCLDLKRVTEPLHHQSNHNSEEYAVSSVAISFCLCRDNFYTSGHVINSKYRGAPDTAQSVLFDQTTVWKVIAGIVISCAKMTCSRMRESRPFPKDMPSQESIMYDHRRDPQSAFWGSPGFREGTIGTK